MKLNSIHSITSSELNAFFEENTADLILLDSGTGSGRSFDWSLIGQSKRPWILAGGLGPDNVAEAAARFHPYAVDLSSGAETDGWKDPMKMRACVEAVRNNTGGMSPASTGGGKQQTFSVAGDNPPLSYSMHARAERKMLPKGSPHAAQRLALRALNGTQQRYTEKQENATLTRDLKVHYAKEEHAQHEGEDHLRSMETFL